MKKTSRICFMSLALALVFSFSLINLPARNISSERPDGSCSDSPDECKPKVKFVKRRGACLTFSCETGTRNEHLIKTNNETAVQTLFSKIEGQKRNPQE